MVVPEFSIMRIAIISDIHGNYSALEQVISDIDQQNIDEIFCLGDIVGYGPSPNECVAQVNERASVSLLGNHDAAAIGLDNIETFNTYAKEAILWTRKELSYNSKNYLSNLKMSHHAENLTYVHGSPLKPEEWTYIATIYVAMEQFSHFPGQVCFIGHTHVAIIFAQNQFSNLRIRNEGLSFEDKERYIINVGAVGQPRDYDPKASYGILDTEKNHFEYRRIQYDIQKTQKLMENAGLPRYLIDRLADGR